MNWCVAAAIVLFAGRAWAAGGNGVDWEAVTAVCGKCHTTAIFEGKPRSWERWNDVFAQMTQHGANGTTEQLVRVTRYFLENLTLVNMNTSAAEEIAGILGVSDDVAAAIVERRQKQRFNSLADVRAVPGVDAANLEQRKSRISF